ncbi:MAG: DDE endonuclease, partial [Symploca sp. SIO2E9]|nr:DDE endonuclease [Symploca sp. SIO2E9]
MRPHKSRYWLTSQDKLDDPDQYQSDVQAVCGVYHEAQPLYDIGTHVVSVDEKTGIQALERLHPTKPTRPDLTERREFEYIRHGVQSLTASFHVATGKVVASTIRATRNEEDFVSHIERTLATDPNENWIFVLDQLNTHMSEGLVYLVAERCGIDEDLGVKGRYGILKTMATRRAFLEDQSHSICFVYTPKHCSWLNQVEIWFSILVRRALKR